VEALAALVEFVHDAAVAAGKLHGAADDGGEDGLEIERGANGLADRVQRLELLYGMGEFPGPRLELAEQPDVLDGDDRLVSEGLEEGDLAPCKAQGGCAADLDRPDGRIFPHQGNAENRAKPHSTCVLTGHGKFGDFDLGIDEVDGPPVEHRSASRRLADQRKEELPPHRHVKAGRTSATTLRDTCMDPEYSKRIGAPPAGTMQ
jgi:hypothetical protein